MNQESEIVFNSTLGQLVCQIKRLGDKYVRQQIFPTGQVFEEDYTEEEYQDFLRRVEQFDLLTTKPQVKGSREQKGKRN